MTRSTLILTALSMFIVLPVSAAVLHVPGQYVTIQSAIDASSPGDEVFIGPGFYEEVLTVNNTSLTFTGAGRAQSLIHFQAPDDTPLLHIENSHLEMRDLAIFGAGRSLGSFVGQSRRGILAADSSLILERVDMDSFVNDFITMYRGDLGAYDLRLGSAIGTTTACDIGLSLHDCNADVDRLELLRGFIDHTIRIQGSPAGPGTGFQSWLRVTGSTIALSWDSWGDGIDLFGYVDAEIDGNTFVRDPNAVMPSVSSAVSVKGGNIRARIVNNHIISAACGVFVNGGSTGNQVVIGKNLFEETRANAVAMATMYYEAVDIGGGSLGGKGGNVFCRNHTSGTGYDVKFASSSMGTVVSALNNVWSARDPQDSIWDVHDDSLLGTVVYSTPGSPVPGVCAN